MRPEILSPAGSWESMVAAVQNGADAVYLGVGTFNARRSAKNFAPEDLLAAVQYCHLRGTRVYLTLNTLLGDRELEEAAEAARKAALPPLEIEPFAAENVDFDTFCKSDFRAVKVKACENVKKSDKLLKFTLDDGSGVDRTILSGIRQYYAPEDLIGKTAIAILNLPPRKMMGIPSCGMLISAVHKEKGEEKLHLMLIDDSVPAGAKLC